MNINSSACRMIIMTSYVTTTVLLAAYSAALVSFMTVQDFKLPFSSFRELLQLRHYRLGALSGSAQISYFEVRHYYWHRLSARPGAFLSVYCLGAASPTSRTIRLKCSVTARDLKHPPQVLTDSSHLLFLYLEYMRFPIGPIRQNNVSISFPPTLPASSAHRSFQYFGILT